MTGNIVSVDFRDDQIFAIERDDGVYVAIKPIADRLGLVWRKQRERIQRDPVLSEGGTMVVLPSPGGAQEMLCLRLDLVNGWLFTIDESRVKDENVRQRVLAYKRECYRVLFEHFHGKPKAANDVFDAEPEEPSSEKRRLVDTAQRVFGARAAGELWFELGLRVTPSMFVDQRQMTFIDYRAIQTVDDVKVAN